MNKLAFLHLLLYSENTPFLGAVFTLQDEQGKPLQEGLTTGTDGVVSVNNLNQANISL